MEWKQLKYWSTGEWQVCDERLKELTRNRIAWNPGRSRLWRSMDLCPLDTVRCVIVGQDPYPRAQHATGVAFSVPLDCLEYPPTLNMILEELKNDQKIETNHGNLEKWCEQGVLLWNCIPSCELGRSKSHDWPEWRLLTAEVFKILSAKHCPFALLGSTAADYDVFINQDVCDVIYTCHPSPRAHINTTNPFLGSRLFSRINVALKEVGYEQIDWSL